MAEISWTGTVSVGNGPRFTLNRTFAVEAYEHVTVTIAAGATDRRVQVQPGGAGSVAFLLITATSYDPALTYRVNLITATPVPLNNVQLFAGTGAVGLIGAAPPADLFFSNTTPADVVVEILVGRDATP